MKNLISGITFTFFILTTVHPLLSQERKLIPGRTTETFYHNKLKKIILINGCYDPGPWHTKNIELWQWNNKTWELISDTGPEVRNGFGWAYDNTRKKLVIYSGTVAGASNNRKWFTDTWEWDGKNWLQIETQTNPGIRFFSGMVYDPVRKSTLLFGGANDKFELHNDTWGFDGKEWKQLFINGPSQRWPATMFYFPATKKIYVYGGHTMISPTQRGLAADTWELNESGWKEIESSSLPGKQEGVKVVFDEKSNEMWMVCGGLEGPEPKFVNTTWAFNGNKWRVTNIKNLPSRGGHGLVYDPSAKIFLAQGGFNIGGGPGMKDTWILEKGKTEWKCISGCMEDQEQWIAAHPADADALLIFIANSHYTGKPENIKKAVSQTLQAGLLSRNDYRRVARYLSSLKRYQECILYYEKAIALQPTGVDFYNMACAYAKMDNKDKAFENLNLAADNNFNAKKDFENDTDLQSLKSDSRFQQLLLKLK